MIIKITQLNDEQKTIEVKSLDKKLEISKTSDSWNGESINGFLTYIATKNLGENIEIEFDQDNENEIYKFVVKLFNSFSGNVNKEV